MHIDTEEIRRFLVHLCEESHHPLVDFWRGYWIDAGHIDRLLLLFQKLDPIFAPRPSLLDIGSFGEFPLILRKFYGLTEVHCNSYEGNFIAYGRGKILDKADPAVEIGILNYKCDVEREPLHHPDGSLDVVTCFEVLEHLRYDPMHMLLEIHRVLRPDGLMVLSTPNLSSWDSLEKLVLFRSPCLFSAYFADGSGIGHCKEYTVEELWQIVETAGFAIQHFETFDTLPPYNPRTRTQRTVLDEIREILERNGLARGEQRGQTSIVHARKRGVPRRRKYSPLYTGDVSYP